MVVKSKYRQKYRRKLGLLKSLSSSPPPPKSRFRHLAKNTGWGAPVGQPYRWVAARYYPEHRSDWPRGRSADGEVPNPIHPPAGCSFHPAVRSSTIVAVRTARVGYVLESGHIVLSGLGSWSDIKLTGPDGIRRIEGGRKHSSGGPAELLGSSPMTGPCGRTPWALAAACSGLR